MKDENNLPEENGGDSGDSSSDEERSDEDDGTPFSISTNKTYPRTEHALVLHMCTEGSDTSYSEADKRPRSRNLDLSQS